MDEKKKLSEKLEDVINKNKKKLRKTKLKWNKIEN